MVKTTHKTTHSSYVTGHVIRALMLTSGFSAGEEPGYEARCYEYEHSFVSVVGESKVSLPVQ